jgi:hypothetical protein
MHKTLLASSSSRTIQVVAKQRSSVHRRGRLAIVNMFTGIVQGMATVEKVNSKDNFSEVSQHEAELFHDVTDHDSIYRL